MRCALRMGTTLVSTLYFEAAHAVPAHVAERHGADRFVAPGHRLPTLRFVAIRHKSCRRRRGPCAASAASHWRLIGSFAALQPRRYRRQELAPIRTVAFSVSAHCHLKQAWLLAGYADAD